ncbi:unnamed protein product [Eruca vesicaria subsp. sativa]|uniref:Uncharacterized protein n=1 Tax=Eruca vesicaria subsp. sativa TaxID=29727 RepID=A0ABC8JR87_ERUVS|nr:unnamed protein product [Eruca vesicaria subsp. sativa]
MGRSPCCDESGLKKGPWTPEEDQKLINHIRKHGHGSWRALPKQAGLNRCGKSCRLRWTNYLRPDIKRGNFTAEEEQTIINLHSLLGNKWSSIAGHLPGRTDNEIKNYWNTHIRKKLIQMGIDPVTHRPRTDHLNVLAALPQLLAAANFNNLLTLNQNIQLDATSIAKAQWLHSMIQLLNNNNMTSSSSVDINIFGQSSFLENRPNISENPYDVTQSLSHVDHQPMDSFSSPIGVFSHQDIIPPLISASPDESKQTQMMIKNKEILKLNEQTSNPSSTLTFTQDHQAWCDIIDDEASDSYWKEIIEQTCSEPWPFRE